jgi:flagellin
MNGISAQVAPGTFALSSIIKTYNSAMSTSLERIASGLRINRPSDDVGSYFRAKELNSLAESSGTAAKSLENHISRLKTAEDGLTSISDLMTQMSDLAKEASQETDAATRSTLGQQYDNLRDAISTVVNTTRYEGALLLNGAYDANAKVNNVAGAGSSVQVGEQVNDTFNYQILDTRVSKDGTTGSDTFSGLNIVSTSVQATWADATTGQAAALATYATLEEEDSGMIRVRRNLSRISTNLSVISGARTGLENKQNNYQAASSSLVGVDQAEETSRYASLQIQQQAAASFLAQSNMAYGSVVSILTGYGRR